MPTADFSPDDPSESRTPGDDGKKRDSLTPSKAEKLAADPEYPDRTIMRKLAEWLATKIFSS